MVCEGCGKTTEIPFRAAEVTGQFGRRLTSLVAYLTSVWLLARRLVEGLWAELPGTGIGLRSMEEAWG